MAQIKKKGVEAASGNPTQHPVKLTALLYLREALIKQRYERCPGLVALAKEFGATDREIQYILEDPKRVPT